MHVAEDKQPETTTLTELVTLAKRECPPIGSVEIEQTIEGVGTTRVKVSKG